MYFKKDFFITLFFVAGILFYSNPLEAIPARPTPVVVTQGNGEELTVRMKGDEYFNYTTTLDDYIIRINNEKNYCYLTLNEQGEILVSSVIAHDVEKRTEEEKNFLLSIDTEKILKTLNQDSVRKNAYKRNAGEINHKKTTFPVTGEIRTLVILVEFQNIEFTIENPVEEFSRLLNESGYNVNGASGSAREYFIANSDSAFLPQFDVYGPVKLQYNTDYYNQTDAVNGLRRMYMAAEACTQLSENGTINLADYDLDGDGIVDNIYLFCAGYSAADFPEGDSRRELYIWPHKFDLDRLDMELGGKKLSSYACSTELTGTDGKGTMTSIGGFVHEFCHVLGLPDLYTTNGYSAPTPRDYSVLDHGCYNNNQRTPCNLSAYERYCLGWTQPVELKETPLNIGIRELAASNKSYIIKTSLQNEFFVLENRQLTGWDEYLPGHGMLVWHIDYDEQIWENNAVNNDADYQRVHLIEADGIVSTGTYNGNPFPGGSNVTSFTDTSSPAMKTWNGERLNKGLTEIKEENGLIFFRFKGGVQESLAGKVEALPATEEGEISFNANWTPYQGNFFGYILEVSYWTGEEWEILKEYDGIDAGSNPYYLLTGLDPDTRYKYRVAVTDGFSTTAYSNEVTVKTQEAVTFEYMMPEVRTYDISGDYFVINWKCVVGATSYLVEVYQKEYTDPEGEVLLDFTDRLVTANNLGWTSDANNLLIPEGYYGEATPSLRFDQPGRYLQSPIYDSNITSLSFWYAGRNNSSEDAVVMRGYDGSNWVELWRKDNLSEEKETIGEIIEFTTVELGNIYGISIVFERVSGSQGVFFLDDLTLEYGSKLVFKEIKTENVLAGSEDTFLFRIDNLQKDQYYYYTVTGLSADSKTRTSKEMEVFTDEFSSSKEMEEETSVLWISTESIYIQVSGNFLNSLDIYNLMGTKVYSSTFSQEIEVSKNSFSKGVYLVKVNQEIHKIIIQ